MVEEILWSRTIPALQVPHQVELVRSATLPPVDQISCSFVLAVDRSERVLLTYIDVHDRGWDVPGGHLDPGETPQVAALRELREETGYALREEDLSVVGWTRVSLEERPANYRYPYPVSYLVFFLSRVDGDGPPTEPEPGSESAAAGWLTLTEVAERCKNPDWLALLRVVLS